LLLNYEHNFSKNSIMNMTIQIYVVLAIGTKDITFPSTDNRHYQLYFFKSTL
jgi:hypothetical protein